MHYLEDWMGYLRLLSCAPKVAFFNEFVGEFRAGSDGNTPIRKRPFEFDRCTTKVRNFAKQLAKQSGSEGQESLKQFPQSLAARLSPEEIQSILAHARS
jgi:hypothetical protein